MPNARSFLRRTYVALRCVRAAHVLVTTVVVAILAVPALEGREAWRDARRWRPTDVEPVVLQSHPQGCGAALLATMLAWHGRPVSESVLLHQAPPGPDGISLASFRDLAGRHGIHGQWRRLPRGRIPRGAFVAHLDRPFGHFVWVTDQIGEYLHVVDPLTGPGVWHADRFRARYSGRYFVTEESS